MELNVVELVFFFTTCFLLPEKGALNYVTYNFLVVKSHHNIVLWSLIVK